MRVPNVEGKVVREKGLDTAQRIEPVRHFVPTVLILDLRARLLLTLLSIGVVLTTYTLCSCVGGRAPSRTETISSGEPAR